MTDQPKTPGQAAQQAAQRASHHVWDWDAIAQAAIQASGLVGAAEAVVAAYEDDRPIDHHVRGLRDALAKLKGQTNG